MKTVVALTVLGAASAVDQTDFKAWAAEHGKTYPGLSQFKAAANAFVINARVVDELNAENDGAAYALNKARTTQPPSVCPRRSQINPRFSEPHSSNPEDTYRIMITPF